MEHLRVGRVAMLVVLVSLGGCAGLLDPYQREGTWHSTGVNDDNLKAMLVNPTDFEHGSGATDSEGQGAAIAVGRYRDDRIKKLPEGTFGGGGGTNNEGGGVSNAGSAQ